MDVFCELVDRIHSPHFGVNYDPSNTILAGEDPLALLDRVKDRVVTMHASDRYLAEGTIEDLRKEEDSIGYAKRLRHGVIGRGMNDYDAIFSTLAGVGFAGWIRIEVGDGLFLLGHEDGVVLLFLGERRHDRFLPEDDKIGIDADLVHQLAAPAGDQALDHVPFLRGPHTVAVHVKVPEDEEVERRVAIVDEVGDQ